MPSAYNINDCLSLLDVGTSHFPNLTVCICGVRTFPLQSNHKVLICGAFKQGRMILEWILLISFKCAQRHLVSPLWEQMRLRPRQKWPVTLTPLPLRRKTSSIDSCVDLGPCFLSLTSVSPYFSNYLGLLTPHLPDWLLPYDHLNMKVWDDFPTEVMPH